MSQEELVSAFTAGQLSRRDFIKKMAIVGGAVGIALTATQDALAEDVETTAKKAAGKKGTAKKPTSVPPVDPTDPSVQPA